MARPPDKDDPDVEIVEPDPKSEDERDAFTVQALARRRSLASAGQQRRKQPLLFRVQQPQLPAELKRKRADIEEERVTKRRRQQPGAVLLDTGRTRTMVTTTTLVNLRPMLFLSSAMSWVNGPPLKIRRGACSAVRVDEHRLIVVGGSEGTNDFGTTEVLDFRDFRRMSFSYGPRMASQRRECAAIMLDEFRLLVVGGYDGQHFLNTTEVLDIRTNRFQAGPRMASRRAAPALGRLPSGHIAVVGGKNSFGCLETTETLSVGAAALSFMPGPNMQFQRAGPLAVVLDSTRLIVMGGHDNGRTHNTTEVLRMVDAASSPPLMRFRPGPDLTTPRSYFGGVLLNAGNLHILGGHDGYNYLNTTEVLNLATMEFTTGPRMKRRRFMCTASTINEDRVLVVGGSDDSVDHGSTEMLSLPLYSFTPASWMSQC